MIADMLKIEKGCILGHNRKSALAVHALDDGCHPLVEGTECNLGGTARAANAFGRISRAVTLAILEKQEELRPAAKEVPFVAACRTLTLRSAGTMGCCAINPAELFFCPLMRGGTSGRA